MFGQTERRTFSPSTRTVATAFSSAPSQARPPPRPARLDVRSGLPVRDRNRRDADSDDHCPTEDAGASVSGAAAAEAGKPERAQDAADQSPDMPALRDARDREREDEVDDDDAERTSAEHVVALPFEHEARAEDAKDSAGRAHSGNERRPQKGPCRAREPRDDVEREEAARPDALFEQRAEPVQSE